MLCHLPIQVCFEHFLTWILHFIHNYFFRSHSHHNDNYAHAARTMCRLHLARIHELFQDLYQFSLLPPPWMGRTQRPNAHVLSNLARLLFIPLPQRMHLRGRYR